MGEGAEREVLIRIRTVADATNGSALRGVAESVRKAQATSAEAYTKTAKTAEQAAKATEREWKRANDEMLRHETRTFNARMKIIKDRERAEVQAAKTAEKAAKDAAREQEKAAKAVESATEQSARSPRTHPGSHEDEFRGHGGRWSRFCHARYRWREGHGKVTAGPHQDPGGIRLDAGLDHHHPGDDKSLAGGTARQ